MYVSLRCVVRARLLNVPLPSDRKQNSGPFGPPGKSRLATSQLPCQGVFQGNQQNSVTEGALIVALADGFVGVRTRALLILVNGVLGVGEGLARVPTVADMALTVDCRTRLMQMVQITKDTMMSENITFIVIPSGLPTKFKTREAALVGTC